jgi:hypothetical protein
MIGATDWSFHIECRDSIKLFVVLLSRPLSHNDLTLRFSHFPASLTTFIVKNDNPTA